ncbi:MFS general substrate transporter [Agrocybe pediades]|nr:MFS general substrate transporter [Agrocybe pediades]
MQHTPLPAAQIAILLLLKSVESASTFVIFPFLNELFSSVTGGDNVKVGYYAGLMVRRLYLFLPSHIGRKPVLLLGTLALGVSITSFGLSKTFWALVVSRCIFTALNSNAGVIKSMLGEITDHSNSADAFDLLHIPWAVGSSFGALAEHFPRMFGGPFWSEYPYFLPCAVMGLISSGGFLVVFVGLDEGLFYRHNRADSSPEVEPLLASSLSDRESEVPVRLQELLQYRRPGLAPQKIGLILGTYGVANSICQTLLLGRLVRQLGVKNVLVVATSAFIPMFMFPPLMNLLVESSRYGFSYAMWIMLACCIYIFITAAAPNKRSLGATNGFAQTLVSIGRIVTPAMASSLLSLSIERHILWGYASYAALVGISLAGVWLAWKLPRGLQ